MTRRYSRDARGRFASGGGGGATVTRSRIGSGSTKSILNPFAGPADRKIASDSLDRAGARGKTIYSVRKRGSTYKIGNERISRNAAEKIVEKGQGEARWKNHLPKKRKPRLANAGPAPYVKSTAKDLKRPRSRRGARVV
jgi:hypothetical protein